MGETLTQDGHKIYFSGRDDKHEHRAGFLVYKGVNNSVISCQPISSRIITMHSGRVTGEFDSATTEGEQLVGAIFAREADHV